MKHTKFLLLVMGWLIQREIFTEIFRFEIWTLISLRNKGVHINKNLSLLKVFLQGAMDVTM